MLDERQKRKPEGLKLLTIRTNNFRIDEEIVEETPKQTLEVP